MDKSYKILIVDDEKNIRDVLTFALSHSGYSVIEANDGEKALDMFHSTKPNLVVLDVNLPKINGFDVCREIRNESDIPIIFLTVKEEEIDKILGLELGGDDFMTKPFSAKELVARVRAILRRSRSDRSKFKKGDDGNIMNLQRGDLRLNRYQYSCGWKGKNIHLTKIEFEILWALLKRPEMVFSRDILIQVIYDTNISLSQRTIDSHIKKIRDKFLPYHCNPIETLHGFGYRLSSGI